MLREFARIGFRPVDEAGFPASKHRQAQHVQSRRCGDDPALVAQFSLGTDHGGVEPRIIRPIACGPEDRADLTAAQVQRQPRRGGHARGCKALARRDFVCNVILTSPGIERIEQAVHLEVREREQMGETARKERAAIADGRQLADDPDARTRQGIQIQRDVAGRSDQLR